MSLPRLAAVLSFVAAIVSCVAAVMVVPEFRCVLRLPTSQVCDRAVRSDLVTSFQPASTVAGMDTEARVATIRARFEQVEADVAGGRYGAVRKDLGGVRADSAYLTVYVEGADVPKVRARIFNGDVRTVWQAYYQGGQIVFVYQTVSRAVPGGWADFGQERYYFADGSMVRWLSGMQKRSIPASSAEYVDAEQRMRSLGTRMMESAR